MATPTDHDFFQPLPLTMDPTTKQITSTNPTISPDLTEALTLLNSTHRSLLQLDPPTAVTPPPPMPVPPRRSQQITKMREAAQAALKKTTSSKTTDEAMSTDSVRLYSLALEMALQRPGWEAAGLLREELAGLYCGRAGARMVGRQWADAWTDVRCSMECKARGNAGAVVKGARCLVEMGRVGEAKELVGGNVGAEVAGVEGAKAQVAQIQQGHPGLPQAKEQVRNLERDVEELKGLAKELGVSVVVGGDS